MMYRRLRDTRGWSMVAALVSLLVMMILGVSLLSATTQELQQSSRKKKETRALALAEAGVEHMLWQLYEDTMVVPGTIVLNDFGGTATTSVAPFVDDYGQTVPDCITIDSVGKVQGWETAVRVGARYLITIDEHNPVFGYALFSDRDLTLGGDVSFDHNIHSNGNLSMNGGVSIDGSVEAGGNVRVKGANFVSGDVIYGGTYRNTGGTIVGGDTIQDQELIPMPTIDLAYYEDQAVQTYYGGHTFAGTTTLPDGVIYVDGDIHLSGQVVGTGTIVVNGDVDITGDVTYGAEGSELVILTTGQVRVSGGTEIYGLIYAHNVEATAEWTGTGETIIHGSVIADNIVSTGTMTIQYVPPGDIGVPGDPEHPTQIAAFSWEKIF